MDLTDMGGAAAALGGDAGAGAEGGAAQDSAAQGGEGAGAAASGDVEAGAGGADPDWYARLSEAVEGETASNRDWTKAKGFKDLDGLVKSARDTEKALRDSGRIKIPGEGASAEEVGAFRKAIGVPEDARGYEVKLPETNGGLELNTPLIEKLAAAALEAGTPKAAFETLAQAFVQDQVDNHLEAVRREDAGFEAKKKEWGAETPAKMALANAAMRALGLSQRDVARMQAAFAEPAQGDQPARAGVGRVLDILTKIGGGMAEDVIATGGTGRFGITASEAQKELDAIKADPAKGALASKPGTEENARFKRLVDVVAAAAEKDGA